MFEQFRKLLRENRQLWSIVAAAVLMLVLVAWGVWGGFSFEFSQFFAAETPVDPTGNCVWDVRDNAPEGAWFCKNLNCQLDGNPDGDVQHPPQGPAARLNVKIYGLTDVPVNPADGPIHVRTVLDATPKCGNGKECYPPKDPLWTCTAAEGVMYQGRDGSDFYSCYNPIIHRTNYGPIECCANTGLPGDCYTWTLESPTGTASPTPTPTTDVPAPVCAPANQTVAIGQPALLQATGGNGTSYTWDFSGGGTLEEGGNRDIVISWNTPGQKIIRVTSAGKTSEACIVFVGSPSPSPSSAPGAGTVSKLVRNTTLGGSGSTATTVAFGQTLVFTIRIENNGAAAMTGLVVKDEVPVGMSYITGSTRVENIAVPSNAITVTGLELGRLEAGDPVTIEWSAVANQSGLLQPGSSRVYTATVTSDAGGSQTAGVTVGVTGTAATVTPTGTSGTGTPGTGTGGTGTPGSVPTGPSDSVLVALGAAALISLLYASYTRSPYFRRHELNVLGKQRDPLDFRG